MSKRDTRTLSERVWPRIKVLTPIECWLWQGCTTKAGYGLLTFNCKNLYVHRVAYELYHGPIPKGLDVLHGCDNPPCCNPYHLFLGTALDNAQDMMSKGRNRHEAFPGEKHPNAKLTEDQAYAIRQMADEGINQTEIGRLFGVSQSTVMAIRTRRNWRHLK